MIKLKTNAVGSFLPKLLSTKIDHLRSCSVATSFRHDQTNTKTEKGSAKTGREPVGKLTTAQVREIAEKRNFLI